MKLGEIFDNNPVFETERLILRKLELTDAEDYYVLASDPAVTTHTTWSRHETLEDSIGFIERVNERVRLRQAYHWGILYKPKGLLIGRTGIINVDPVNERSEIGYALASEYWNLGIVTEATKRIVAFLFNEVGFNRLEARCNENNPGSYRVMEKIGMTCEGLLRKQLKINGMFLDQRTYSILKEEYFEEKKADGQPYTA